MKPSSNFKLPKSVKRLASTIVNPHRCGEYRRAMIDACVSSQEPVRRDRSSRSERK